MKCLLIGLALLLGTPSFAQPNNRASNIQVTWGEDKYEIRYVKNGRKKVLRGRHGIPREARILAQGTRPAQKASDHITTANMNYALLDSLIWVKSNEYRQKRRLKPFDFHPEVRRAASSHSYYMAYFNNLRHDEVKRIPGRKAEQDHYKAIFQGCAEIVLYNYGTFGKSTYNEMAELCIREWRNSPGHNKILKNRYSTYSAFGVTLYRLDENYIRKEDLKKYNPELLKVLEREVPNVFWTQQSNTDFMIWATGTFKSNMPDP